jgi:hypothetical protein
MTLPDAMAQRLAAAWVEIYPQLQVKPISFDPEQGRLVVECSNHAYFTQVRLIGGQLVKRINEAIGEPVVLTLAYRLRDIRILVTGSRAWDLPQEVHGALLEAWHDAIQVHGVAHRIVIVHGACPTGADRDASEWAQANTSVVEEAHPADWSAPCPPKCLRGDHRKTSPQHGDYCPMAGPRRNKAMVDRGADLCLAFIRGGSRGSAATARLAEAAGIPTRRFTA